MSDLLCFLQPLASPVLSSQHTSLTAVGATLLRHIRLMDPAAYAAALCDLASLASSVASILCQMRANGESDVPDDTALLCMHRTAGFSQQLDVLVPQPRQPPMGSPSSSAPSSSAGGKNEGGGGWKALSLHFNSVEGFITLHNGILGILQAAIEPASFSILDPLSSMIATATDAIEMLMQSALDTVKKRRFHDDEHDLTVDILPLLQPWAAVCAKLRPPPSFGDSAATERLRFTIVSAYSGLLTACYGPDRSLSSDFNTSACEGLDDAIAIGLEACYSTIAGHRAASDPLSPSLMAITPLLVSVMGPILRHSRSTALKRFSLQLAHSCIARSLLDDAASLIVPITNSVLNLLGDASLVADAVELVEAIIKAHPSMFVAACATHFTAPDDPSRRLDAAAGGSAAGAPHLRLSSADAAAYMLSRAFLNRLMVSRSEKGPYAKALSELQPSADGKQCQMTLRVQRPSSSTTSGAGAGAGAGGSSSLAMITHLTISVSVPSEFVAQRRRRQRPPRPRPGDATTLSRPGRRDAFALTPDSDEDERRDEYEDGIEGGDDEEDEAMAELLDDENSAFSKRPGLDISEQSLAWLAARLLFPFDGLVSAAATAFPSFPSLTPHWETAVSSMRMKVRGRVDAAISNGLDSVLNAAVAAASPDARPDKRSIMHGARAMVVEEDDVEEDAEDEEGSREARLSRAQDAKVALAVALELGCVAASHLLPNRLDKLMEDVETLLRESQGYASTITGNVWGVTNAARLSQLCHLILPAALKLYAGSDRRAGLHSLPPLADGSSTTQAANALVHAVAGLPSNEAVASVPRLIVNLLIGQLQPGSSSGSGAGSNAPANSSPSPSSSSFRTAGFCRLYRLLLESACETTLSQAAVMLDAAAADQLSSGATNSSAGSGNSAPVFPRVFAAARERIGFVTAVLTQHISSDAAGIDGTAACLQRTLCILSDITATLSSGLLLLLAYERHIVAPHAAAAASSANNKASTVGKSAAASSSSTGSRSGANQIDKMWNRASDSQMTQHANSAPKYEGPAFAPVLTMATLRGFLHSAAADSTPVLCLPGNVVDVLSRLLHPPSAAAVVGSAGAASYVAGQSSAVPPNAVTGSGPELARLLTTLDSLRHSDDSLSEGSGLYFKNSTSASLGGADNGCGACGICRGSRPVRVSALAGSGAVTADTSASLLRLMDIEPLIIGGSASAAAAPTAGGQLPDYRREPRLSSPLVPSLAAEPLASIGSRLWSLLGSPAGSASPAVTAVIAALLHHAAAEQIRLPQHLESGLLRAILLPTPAVAAGAGSSSSSSASVASISSLQPLRRDCLAPLCVYVAACCDLLPWPLPETAAAKAGAGAASTTSSSPSVPSAADAREASRLSSVIRRVLLSPEALAGGEQPHAAPAIVPPLIRLDLTPEGAAAASQEEDKEAAAASQGPSSSPPAGVSLAAATANVATWLDAEGPRKSLPSIPFTQRDSCFRLLMAHLHRVLRVAASAGSLSSVEDAAAALSTLSSTAAALSAAASDASSETGDGSDGPQLQTVSTSHHGFEAYPSVLPLLSGKVASQPRLTANPSYLVAECLTYSNQQHLARGVLALIDAWAAVTIASDVSGSDISSSMQFSGNATQQSSQGPSQSQSAPQGPVSASKQAIAQLVAEAFRRLALSHGLTPVSLLLMLKEEVMPRAAITLLHPRPAALLSPSGSGAKDAPPSLSGRPLFERFVSEFLDGEVSPHNLLMDCLPVFLPTLLSYRGGQLPQLQWLAWYLRVAFSDVTVNLRFAAEAPAPAPAAATPQSGSKRKAGATASSTSSSAAQPRSKRQATLSEFSQPTSAAPVASAVDDVTGDNDIIMEDGAGFDDGISSGISAAFETTPSSLIRLYLGRLLFRHRSYLMARLLCYGACAARHMDSSVSLLLEDTTSGSFLVELSGMFESILETLIWYLGEDPTDSPFNRAAAGIRTFSFLMLSDDGRLAPPPTIKPKTMKGCLAAVMPLTELHPSGAGAAASSSSNAAASSSGASSGRNWFSSGSSGGAFSPERSGTGKSSGIGSRGAQRGSPKHGASSSDASSSSSGHDDADLTMANTEMVSHTAALTRLGTFLSELAHSGGGRRLTESQAVEIIHHTGMLHIPLELMLQRHLLLLLYKLSSIVSRPSETQAAKARALVILQRLIVRVRGGDKLDKFFPSISALLKLALGQKTQVLTLQVVAIWDALVRLLSKPTLTTYFSSVVITLATIPGVSPPPVPALTPSSSLAASVSSSSRLSASGSPSFDSAGSRSTESSVTRAFDKAVAAELQAAFSTPASASASSPPSGRSLTSLLVREDPPGLVLPDWESVCDHFGAPLKRHAIAASVSLSSSATGGAGGDKGKQRGNIAAQLAQMQRGAPQEPPPLRPKRLPFGGCLSVDAIVHRSLRFLLVDSREALSSAFSEVPGVTLVPALAPFAAEFADVAAMEEEQADEAAAAASAGAGAGAGAGVAVPAISDISSPELKAQQRVASRLSKLARLLRHDTEGVQELALKETERLLSTSVPQVHALILRHGEASASPCITDVLFELLELNRRSTSSSIRQLCASCLGQLGAIDPSRVSALSRSEHHLAPELGDAHLVVQLIRTHLVKTLRAAPDTNVQDRIAYAIQQLLHFYREYHQLDSGAGDDAAAASGAGGATGGSGSSSKKGKSKNKAGSDTAADAPERHGSIDSSDEYLEYNLSSAATSGAIPLPKDFETTLRQDLSEVDALMTKGDVSGGDAAAPAAGAGGDGDISGTDPVKELLETLQPYWSSSLFLKSPSPNFSGPYQPFYVSELREAVADLQWDANVISGGANRSAALRAFSSASASGAGGFPSFAPSSSPRLRRPPRSGTHFERWVADWSRYLMEMLCRNGSESSRVRQLWEPCKMVAQHNITAALFLLPYLVRDALVLCGPEVQASIAAEVKAVLTCTDGRSGSGGGAATAAAAVGDDDDDAVGDGAGDDAAAEIDPSDESDAASSAGVVAGFRHRATQAVFTLMDTLKRWHQTTKLGPNVAPPPNCVLAYKQQGITSFFSQVPPRLVSNSASRIHAYARALQAYETHLRETKGGDFGSARIPSGLTRQLEDAPVGGVISGPIPFTRRELFNLQSIYSNIDDPDGMSAIGALRSRLLMSDGTGAGSGADAAPGSSSSSSVSSGGPSSSLSWLDLQERIIDHEHQSRWADALMYYEQALQLQTSSSSSSSSAAGHSRGAGAGGSSSDLDVSHLGGGAGSSDDVFAGSQMQRRISAAHTVSPASSGTLTESHLHRGVLNCLKNVGHLDSAMHRAMGVLSRRPDLAPSVAPYAVEAAWRLGQWQPLSELLSTSSPSSQSSAQLAAVPASAAFGSPDSTDDVSDDPDVSIDASQPQSESSANGVSSSGGGSASRGTDYETSLGAALLSLHRAVETSNAQTKARRAGVAAGLGSAMVAAVSEHVREGGFLSIYKQRGQGGLIGDGLSDYASHSLQIASRLPVEAATTSPLSYRLLSGIARGLLSDAATSSASSSSSSAASSGRHSASSASAAADSAASALTVLSSVASRQLTPTAADLVSRLDLAQLSSASSSSYSPSSSTDSSSFSSPLLLDPIAPHAGRCRDALTSARRDVMVSLAAASMESYTRAYPFLLRLHCLREIEKSLELASATVAVRERAIGGELGLSDRLAMTAPSLQQRESLLALRRALYGIFGMRQAEAGGWLELAKIARATGNVTTANSALMHATSLGSDVAAIHSAKLLHSQGHVHRALQQLEPAERDIASVVARLLEVQTAEAAAAQARGGDSPGLQAAKATSSLEAKRILVATNWMAESRLIGEGAIVQRYKAVIELRPAWEKGFFYLGRYYDSMLKSMRADAPTSLSSPFNVTGDWIARRDKVLLAAVENYTFALVHGHSKVFQSLPRVLTLFFDYGAACAAAASRGPGSSGAGAGGNGSQQQRPPPRYESQAYHDAVERSGMHFPTEETLARMTQMLRDMRSKMVAYRWMTVLAQMTSRICHRHASVHHYINGTLGAILLMFPQQASWCVIGLAKSRVQLRRERGEHVMKQAKKEKPDNDVRRIVSATNFLFDELIKIACDQTNGRPSSTGAAVESNSSRYYVDLARSNVCEGTPVLLPLQSSLSVKLPKVQLPGETYNGFDPDAPRILKFDKYGEVRGPPLTQAGVIVWCFACVLRRYRSVQR